MKIVNLVLIVSFIFGILSCNESEIYHPDNYKFVLKAYCYPPYKSGINNTIDTLLQGDSMILAIEYINGNVMLKTISVGKIKSEPISPSLGDNIKIQCSNNIIIGDDTIIAGKDLYAQNVKDIISTQLEKRTAGAIFFSGQCRFKNGANLFTFEGVDNFGVSHSDVCTLFVR